MNNSSLSQMWESLVLRGITSILFGIAAVFWPNLTLVTLVYLFSIYILVSAVVGIIEAIRAITRGSGWLWKLLISIIELGVGVYLVRNTLVSFTALILLIGLVLITRGVFEVVSALLEDISATEKTLMVIGGILAVIVGIIVLLQPSTSDVTFVWVLGLYALLTGPMWIALGVDAKRIIETGTPTKRR